jgi:hypothetical protein
LKDSIESILMKIFDSLRQLLLGEILGDSFVILVNVNIPGVFSVV